MALYKPCKTPIKSFLDWDPEEFVNSLFYSFPKEPTKPPITISYEDGDNKSVKLQLAVAGFKEEDIQVYQEDKSLVLEGSNINRDNVPDRFKISFSYRLPVSEKVDISAGSVNLTDGILTIILPLIEPKKSRKYLLGSGG